MSEQENVKKVKNWIKSEKNRQDRYVLSEKVVNKRKRPDNISPISLGQQIL